MKEANELLPKDIKKIVLSNLGFLRFHAQKQGRSGLYKKALDDALVMIEDDSPATIVARDSSWGTNAERARYRRYSQK